MMIFAFFLMLVVLGGIASLACIIDERSAHRSPLPFAVFFLGLGTFVMVPTLGWLGSYVGPAFGDSLAFFGGPIIGGIGGGLLGYWLGLKRKRRYANENDSRC